uniref:G-protein coupled receptors family 1 profile domain-containing protein n=1 Tax=Poecilia reticulata TaxID=8081 RepID=A0A3P9P7I2_POERE
LSNITGIHNFFILGFPGLSPSYYSPASAVLFLVYLAILVGNIFILVFVIYEKSLQKPTYLVFCHLALTDLSFGTVTLPQIISKYWFGNSIISFYGCFTQMFFVHYLGSVMSFLLLVMALDRFIAICVPLRYPVLITNNIIFALCGSAWFLPLPLMMIIIFQALSLPYCQSNIITQCYCDHISITNQACGNDRKIAQIVALCIAILLLPLGFIILSYFIIILSVLKISSSKGRIRAWSTCTPQLIIICLYYLPRCFVYLANFVGYTFNASVRIVVVMLYSLLPAVVNPIIYCFKTKDIKESLKMKLFTK